MRTVAPAKINWTLEVLGRREDGYHEIRSVMQTIDLCDEVWVKRADELQLEVSGAHEATEDDLALKAARLLAVRVGRELPALIRIEKRVPVAAGLGGGSSDAAAVLRCVNRLYALGLPTEELAAIGADIGSDVPFFVHGGTALVEGRGERVTRLTDIDDIRLLIVVPSFQSAPDKTRRMYDAITPDFYTDGWKSLATAERTREGILVASDFWNVFDAVAELFPRPSLDEFSGPGFAGYKRAMEEAGVEGVHICGSGPSLFGIPGVMKEDEIATRLRRVIDGQVYVGWTLTEYQATGVRD